MRATITVERPNFREMAELIVGAGHDIAATGAMRFFRDERLPKRFDGSLREELGWAKREDWYNRWKARKFGSTVPHVKSGQTRERFRQAQIQVEPQRMMVEIRGLHRGYGFTRHRKPNLREEILKLTDAEVKQIGKTYSDRLLEIVMLELAARSQERVV